MGDVVSLQSAGALWWLVPLGGAILALYLLKMRRKDLVVPASFLWPNMITEVRANSLFQRLRFSWLLLLQLIALALLVFALARPQIRQQGLPGQVTVIVLDVSASMSATDVKPSRFGQAVGVCRGLIEAARPSDRISLIEAGPAPRVVFALSNDSSKMRTALASVRPTDAESDIGEALRLAAALVGNERSGRILLLSDGAFATVTDFAPGKAQLVFRQMGESGENVAITALGVADTTAGRQVFCGLRNYGAHPAGGSVSLFADGKLFNSRKLTIGPRGQEGVTESVPPGARVIEARYDGEDILEADNYAATLADPSSSIRVLLVGQGDPFLEKALALDPRVTLDRAAKVPDVDRPGTAGPGEHNVAVFDGVPEAAVKARGVLAFGAAGGPSPVVASGMAKAPKFVTAADHPLMKFVDLRDTYIDSVQRVRTKAAGEVLAECGAGPLIVAAEGEKRQVYVAFKPLDSDFPLQVSFPIFISNALDFLAERETARASGLDRR
jgi:hypothetical protein